MLRERTINTCFFYCNDHTVLPRGWLLLAFAFAMGMSISLILLTAGCNYKQLCTCAALVTTLFVVFIFRHELSRMPMPRLERSTTNHISTGHPSNSPSHPLMPDVMYVPFGIALVFTVALVIASLLGASVCAMIAPYICGNQATQCTCTRIGAVVSVFVLTILALAVPGSRNDNVLRSTRVWGWL